jgi:thiamine pyrophosphate-dependent acetolactate synthase large subunit-like protein
MTFSILESYQQTPVDPVQQALEAFVEAARHSDKPFSVEQLTEMVKAEALHEGFWKQWFSGHDDDQLKDFRKKLQGKIKTEGDRKKLLDEIDDAIDNANRIVTDNNVSRWFTTAGLTMLISIIPLLVKMIPRLSNADQRKAFRESLHKLRSEVVALKLKD